MFLIKWNRFAFDDHPGGANVACPRLEDSGEKSFSNKVYNIARRFA